MSAKCRQYYEENPDVADEASERMIEKWQNMPGEERTRLRRRMSNARTTEQRSQSAREGHRRRRERERKN